MKIVYLEDLPRWDSGKNKRSINWKESVGYKVKFIYDDIEGEVEIVDYISKEQFIYIKYQDKDVFSIKTSCFQRCTLGKLLGKTTNKFKVEIEQIFKDDNRDLVIIDREYRPIYNKNEKLIQNHKYYKYKCNKCEYDEGWIEESNLLKHNTGCSCCHGLTIVQGINDIPTTDTWMVKYFQGGYDEAKLYTYSSNKSIKPICPECGRVKDKEMQISTIYKYKSISCSCGDGFSYPEKFMFNILEQLSVDFETQFSPEWIGKKKYDFYFAINNKQYIVEMDGGLGHGKKVHSFTKRSTKETQADDDYKDEQARLHNVEVIRIDADESELEYIKNNILNSKLSELFNISNIDWTKCEEFALSNRVKEACELKRDNPEMTTTEIGKIMGLVRSTVKSYLKKGTKLGWCDYDPKEEMRKSGIKSGKLSTKPVEIFKDGVSLGTFESATELERQSEELFGVKLNRGNISSVCMGKRNRHKIYKFKFATSITNN